MESQSGVGLSGRRLERLLALVEQECTTEAVQDILREAKASNKGVRVTEKNKALIISKNLRAALDSNAISPEAVYNVLRRSEENGGQHIFLYRVKPAQLASYQNGDRIAVGMFGRDWKKSQNFPQFHLEPAGAVWADFRSESADGNRISWVAKMYSGVESRKFIEERSEGETRVIRVYEKELSREVYLVRFHPWGLLELRVPQTSSLAEVREFLSQLWQAISGAVDPRHFDPWTLHDVCYSLIEMGSIAGKIRIGNARMIDGQEGNAEFNPPSSEEDLFSDAARRRAVKLYEECREVVAYWLKLPDKTPEELRTVVCKCEPHSILIAAKAPPEAVDYVIYRLKDIAEGKPLP
jgi:hypothetical protein